jgi:hypothetical protein
MEAVSTSETSVNFYQTTRRNIPEDSHLVFNSLKCYLYNGILQLDKQKHTSNVLVHHVLNEVTAFNVISLVFEVTSALPGTARIWINKLMAATM